MPIGYILPVSITFALLSWSLILLWYVHPALKNRPLAQRIEPFLLMHSFRYIGLMFLLPGVTAEALDSRFAVPAAYGDLLAAVLALLALAAIRWRASQALLLVWVFNIWGMVDLINAVARGILFTPDGHLGATFWIPAVLVPLLVVTHGYVFWLLLRHGSLRLTGGQVPASA